MNDVRNFGKILKPTELFVTLHASDGEPTAQVPLSLLAALVGGCAANCLEVKDQNLVALPVADNLEERVAALVAKYLAASVAETVGTGESK